MDKVVVAMLATAPLQAFLGWAACWLTLDTLRERRKARTAATAALASAREHLRNRRPEPMTPDQPDTPAPAIREPECRTQQSTRSPVRSSPPTSPRGPASKIHLTT